MGVLKPFLVVIALMGPLAGFLACYPYDPPPCAANDRSCLPCTNPQNTDPSCPPFPSDAKRPTDGGIDR